MTSQESRFRQMQIRKTTPTVISVATSDRLRSLMRARLHEPCKLTFHRLDRAVPPALGDRLGRGIGKDILFAFLEPVEDPLRCGLDRGLRYLEAAGHIGVGGTDDDGVDGYAVGGQQRSE